MRSTTEHPRHYFSPFRSFRRRVGLGTFRSQQTDQINTSSSSSGRFELDGSSQIQRGRESRRMKAAPYRGCGGRASRVAGCTGKWARHRSRCSAGWFLEGVRGAVLTLHDESTRKLNSIESAASQMQTRSMSGYCFVQYFECVESREMCASLGVGVTR